MYCQGPSTRQRKSKVHNLPRPSEITNVRVTGSRRRKTGSVKKKGGARDRAEEGFLRVLRSGDGKDNKFKVKFGRGYVCASVYA